ncbi:glycosyl transferase [Hesseltinella vesiculosa]|uniref:Alpha-1,4 glucan phosphorylase n=1 Tax=Hesseltinella vesiculosa TaxID=101127 RepID=A0A1X2G7G8_9FUNG|nr:glycosyl transferase [Hesseltinella vesiculosa]
MTRPTPQRRLSMPKLTRRLTNIVIHDDDLELVPASTVPSTPTHEKLQDEYLDQWGKALEQSPLANQQTDVASLQASIAYHMNASLFRTQHNLEKVAVYQALAHSMADKLLLDWNRTQQRYRKDNPKRVYYLSMEFLLGRALDNAMLALHMKTAYQEAVQGLGFRLEDLLEQERDPALGNGGLGRLAACYMDAAAALDLPMWGYGLRYQYGLFRQSVQQGFQVEAPDDWLMRHHPWEFPRDIKYDVQFYGYVATKMNDKGESRLFWESDHKIRAVAYDVPVPGKDGFCGNIRLWASQPPHHGGFDLDAFNQGNYDQSIASLKDAFLLTSVLYPNDNHQAGKELRLKQEYFFVSASVQDVVHRFKRYRCPWSEFPNKVAFQLNDTHPTLAIPELQRILVDVEGLAWDDAWDIVTRTFAFTNHTVLPEALEKWPIYVMEKVLPRHMQIIYDLNLFFLQKVEEKFPGDRDLLNRVSIIEEASPQQVRMAFLAVVGSHSVNGVAALHSELVVKELFNDFSLYYGKDKFINITNGISPRRWLYQANPGLRDLITHTLGSEDWVADLPQLQKLAPFADNLEFQQQWMAIKYANKVRLTQWIRDDCGLTVDPRALFDIQVKRMHEYKRQFLNILGVIHRYRVLLQMSPEARRRVPPRVVIFGGKAAPGYAIAKLVIKLINSVADVVNNDPVIDDHLKVVYLPDYNVSLAEKIVPASDISQHISTAGTEASGTSNMKFVINGGLILGTVDGANIEIRDEIGEDNIFLFGTLADQVADIRHAQKYHGVLLDANLQSVLDAIQAGVFGDASIFNPLIDTLTYGGDFYLISEDFDAYIKRQNDVDALFLQKAAWAAKSIRCTAGMGFFSSDRSIGQYASRIWKVDKTALGNGSTSTAD